MRQANLNKLNDMLSKQNSMDASVCNCGRPNSPAISEILK